MGVALSTARVLGKSRTVSLFAGLVGDSATDRPVAPHRDDYVCHALTFLDVGSFQTHDHRNFDAQILCGFNYASRNHVATNDATKDIDEYSVDAGV